MCTPCRQEQSTEAVIQLRVAQPNGDVTHAQQHLLKINEQALSHSAGAVEQGVKALQGHTLHVEPSLP